MAETRTYQAAILRHCGWTLTDNAQEIIEAEPDKLIFCRTVQELTAELQGRYIDPNEPTITRHLTTLYGNDGRGYLQETIGVTEKHTYTGADVNEFVRILIEHPELNEEFLAVSSIEFDKFLREHGLEFGVCPRYTGGHGDWHYAPEKAQKTIKQKEYNKRRLGISVNEPWSVIRTLSWAIAAFVPMTRLSTNGWHGTVGSLNTCVTIFNLLFGEKAHRKTESFQALVKKWRDIDPLGKKRVRSYSKKFHDWMNVEAAARLPRVSYKFRVTKAFRLPWHFVQNYSRVVKLYKGQRYY